MSNANIRKSIKYTLTEIQEMVYIEYQKNGYVNNWALYKQVGEIAELGLIHSEVSEAMELIRNKELEIQNPEKKHHDLGFELADIIIRTLNFASRKGINVEFYILNKHQKNMERGFLHDKTV